MPKASATWEDARRCPKCEEVGLVVSSKPAAGANTLITLKCQNERCKWFGTDWIVQRRADGSIPAPSYRPSGLRPLPDDGGRTAELLERQLEAMKKPGAEMPNRR